MYPDHGFTSFGWIWLVFSSSKKLCSLLKQNFQPWSKTISESCIHHLWLGLTGFFIKKLSSLLLIQRRSGSVSGEICKCGLFLMELANTILTCALCSLVDWICTSIPGKTNNVSGCQWRCYCGSAEAELGNLLYYLQNLLYWLI